MSEASDYLEIQSRAPTSEQVPLVDFEASGEVAGAGEAYEEVDPASLITSERMEDGGPVAVTQVRERPQEGAMSDGTSLADIGHELQRVDERSHLYTDSPPTSQSEVVDHFNGWRNGESVQSNVVAVGLIAPTPEEIAFLNSSRMRHAYGGLYDQETDDWHRVASLERSLEAVVRADMERGGLDGILDLDASMGYFGHGEREPLHSDENSQPTLRWTVAVGVGATVGANGLVDRNMVGDGGDIHSGRVEVGPGKQLKPVTFRENEVVRFRNSGDIHGGPEGTGPRIFVLATLSFHVQLQQYTIAD